MANAVGMNASVTFLSGHSLCADKVRITESQALIPTTCFGATHEGNTGGLKSGRLMVEGTPKYNVTASNAGFGSISSSGGAFTITVASGCTISGNCILSDQTFEADVNGSSRLTYNAATDGAISSVWDEAA